MSNKNKGGKKEMNENAIPAVQGNDSVQDQPATNSTPVTKTASEKKSLFKSMKDGVHNIAQKAAPVAAKVKKPLAIAAGVAVGAACAYLGFELGSSKSKPEETESEVSYISDSDDVPFTEESVPDVSASNEEA